MGAMEAKDLTKDDVINFFNSYKFNTRRIETLQRQLLSESNVAKKWQSFIAQISDMTRALYTKNESLLEKYLKPLLAHPEALGREVMWEVLLHVTFYLFDNNIDSLMTSEIIDAVLAHKEVLDDQCHFEALFDLGIFNTLSVDGSFRHTYAIFEEALAVYPDFRTIHNQDTKIHIVFCKIFQMLSFALYNRCDCKLFIQCYEETRLLLEQGDAQLFSKMWGDGADGVMHVKLLLRFCRVYGVFMAGRGNFSNDYDGTVSSWLVDEYEAERTEGQVNLMIFTYYNKLLLKKGELTSAQYHNVLMAKVREEVALYGSERRYIFPESAFPIDDDPVEKQFSLMLDKMKLFNRTFSYIHVMVNEVIHLTHDKEEIKVLVREVKRFFEASRYAQKGFKMDRFESEVLEGVAIATGDMDTFMEVYDVYFVHRQISTSIHLSMVRDIATMLFKNFVQKRPELFTIAGKAETAEEVKEQESELLQFIERAALLHDIGKITQTQLINLQWRRITEKEFFKIRAHTDCGGLLCENAPILEPFYDIAMGHHKFWEDLGGYPSSFSLRASPLKYYVALITLADCIDSSTDTQGRNYTTQKSLSEVFAELELDSGTRYCPDLVKMLLEDEALKALINEKVTVGRKGNLEQCYKRFIEHKVMYSSSKASAIDLIDEKLAENLPAFYKECYKVARSVRVAQHVKSLLFGGENSLTLVMHSLDGQVYAILSGEIIYPVNEDSFLDIKEFLVAPNMRRAGLGTRLLARASKILDGRGVQMMRVHLTEGISEEVFFWIGGFAKIGTYELERRVS